MRADEYTIITVSFHAADALALMWESFLKFHERPRWLVFDNGSKDGALEYAKEHADLVLEGDNGMSHGERISQLADLVETPYLLHSDNDIEYKSEVLHMLRRPFENEKTYCSCLTRLYEWGTFDVFGMIMKAMWSPNIAVGLLRKDVVDRIHSFDTSFGYYCNDKRREYYETGGMAWRFALAMGYECAELPELWERVVHHGSISTLWSAAVPDPVILERYEVVKKNLEKLRARSPINA